jgi:hypothetical protein
MILSINSLQVGMSWMSPATMLDGEDFLDSRIGQHALGIAQWAHDQARLQFIRRDQRLIDVVVRRRLDVQSKSSGGKRRIKHRFQRQAVRQEAEAPAPALVTTGIAALLLRAIRSRRSCDAR